MSSSSSLLSLRGPLEEDLGTFPDSPTGGELVILAPPPIAKAISQRRASEARTQGGATSGGASLLRVAR